MSVSQQEPPRDADDLSEEFRRACDEVRRLGIERAEVAREVGALNRQWDDAASACLASAARLASPGVLSHAAGLVRSGRPESVRTVDPADSPERLAREIACAAAASYREAVRLKHSAGVRMDGSRAAREHVAGTKCWRDSEVDRWQGWFDQALACEHAAAECLTDIILGLCGRIPINGYGFDKAAALGRDWAPCGAWIDGRLFVVQQDDGADKFRPLLTMIEPGSVRGDDVCDDDPIAEPRAVIGREVPPLPPWRSFRIETGHEGDMPDLVEGRGVVLADAIERARRWIAMESEARTGTEGSAPDMRLILEGDRLLAAVDGDEVKLWDEDED